MGYLKEGPCATLLEAFKRLLSSSGYSKSLPLPDTVYVGGQRWGSAFPAPAKETNNSFVISCSYNTSASLGLTPSEDDGGEQPKSKADFLADDAGQLYYASDYVSTRLPGMETAALSGLDVARHIAATVCNK